MKAENLLNIAEYQTTTENLGPGKRFVLWVQGCPFNCKNCVSKQWIPFKVANLIPIDVMVDTILKTPEITGITISGGEPMMQAKRLSKLVKIIKTHKPTLNILVFTGFKLKQLVWEDAKVFLTQIDVLVDGLYVDELNDNQGLRGSRNQKIHFLNNSTSLSKEYFHSKQRDLEFRLKDSGVLMIGIPEKGFKW